MDVTAFLQSHQNLWIWFLGLPTPRPPPKSGSAFLANVWSSLSSRCDVNQLPPRPVLTTAIMEQRLLRSMWPRQWHKHSDYNMRTISEVKRWYNEQFPCRRRGGSTNPPGILSTGPSHTSMLVTLGSYMLWQEVGWLGWKFQWCNFPTSSPTHAGMGLDGNAAVFESSMLL